MSTTKPKITLPELSIEERQFAENQLALGMPYETAIQSFLESFPSILENYEISEELTEEEIKALTEEEIETEIRRILRMEFSEIRKNTPRISYHQIKAKQETIKSFLDCIPIASPFLRLIELEIMRQDKTLKPEQLIKALAAAAREVDRLIPREKVSPFRTLGMELPDLMPKEGEKITDPFGGAMFRGNKTNTEDETSQDS